MYDDTNELQTDNIPGTLTTMDGKIDAQDAIITEARLAELDAANLPADVAAVPTAAENWAHVVENSKTAEQLMRGMFAALCGLASGGGTTTHTFRDDADTKNRISTTTTSVGNRTAVVFDLT